MKRSEYIFLIPILLFSCDRFLEAEFDKSKITENKVFTTDVTATAAVTAMYNTMSGSELIGGTTGINVLTSLSSEELSNVAQNPTFAVFEQHRIVSQDGNIETLWNNLYNLIYQSNLVIEGLQNSHTLSSRVATQLKGEALFMRAFCYFYLVNLFGEIPLATRTDYSVNRLLPRTSVDDIYALIESDLLTSQSILPVAYVTENRVRPNRATTTALLARMYLYRKQYVQAEEQASTVINDNSYTLIKPAGDISQIFSINSLETIWQVMPTTPSQNTAEALSFIISSSPVESGGTGANMLTSSLLNQFESGDKRAMNWISSYSKGSGRYYFPFKYKRLSKGTGDPFTECSIAFRLPEMYFIRAEARLHLGKPFGGNSALSDLNAIRNRVGLPDATVNDTDALLLEIEKERWSELFTEYGHRWFDLRRTGRARDVLKNGISLEDFLYPIPNNEFIKNPNLGTQNSGY